MRFSITTIAVKNLVRKQARSTALILVAALAAGLVFGSTLVLQSVRGSLALGMERLGADIMVVPREHEAKGRKILLAGEPTSFYMDRKNFEALAGVQGIQKASPQLFMTSAVLMCCSMPNVLLVGFEPATDFTLEPWIRHVHRVSKKALPEVTIGAQTLYASEGPHMTFYGTTFKIGRSLHPTGVGFLDYSIFMPMDAARNMIENSKTKSPMPLKVGPGQISSVLIRVDRNFDIHRVAAEIEKTVPGVRAFATKDLITAVRKDTEDALRGVMTAGAAAWFMSLVLTGLVFAVIVNERRREFGILRAMGAARKEVFRLVVSESAMLSGLGALIGTAIGLIAVVSFKKMIINSLGDVPFILPSALFIFAVGAVCIFFALLSGIASAAYPAFRESRRDPDEAIRQGR